MDIILLAVAVGLLLGGLLGCFLPIIPGPPLAWAGFFALSYSAIGAEISSAELVITAAIMVVITVLDYIMPTYFTKKFGGSSYGTWGSTIGTILGLFILPPFGLIFGPFVGAFVGEYIGQKPGVSPLKSAAGAFLGFVFSLGLKLAITIYLIYRCVVVVFF